MIYRNRIVPKCVLNVIPSKLGDVSLFIRNWSIQFAFIVKLKI